MSDMPMTAPDENGKELKGRHVLYWMLGFFGIMFAVNGVFLYQAITSFPGEDVKKSYLQGLNYNQTLEARAAQDALGWQAELGLVDNAVILHLQDRAGSALSGQPVIGQMRRRATQQDDQLLVFAPQANGDYRAPLESVDPGQWELRVQVLDLETEESVFTAHKTLLVK